MNVTDRPQRQRQKRQVLFRRWCSIRRTNLSQCPLVCVLLIFSSSTQKLGSGGSGRGCSTSGVAAAASGSLNELEDQHNTSTTTFNLWEWKKDSSQDKNNSWSFGEGTWWWQRLLDQQQEQNHSQDEDLRQRWKTIEDYYSQHYQKQAEQSQEEIESFWHVHKEQAQKDLRQAWRHFKGRNSHKQAETMIDDASSAANGELASSPPPQPILVMEQMYQDIQDLLERHKSYAQADAKLLGEKVDEFLQFHKDRAQADWQSLQHSLEDTAIRMEEQYCNDTKALRDFLQSQSKKLENAIETTLFRQRQGIQAFLKSMQNFIGVFFGTCTTFIVSSRNKPLLIKGAVGVQSTQLMRMILSKLGHYAVIQDVISLGILSLIFAHKTMQQHEQEVISGKDAVAKNVAAKHRFPILWEKWIPLATIIASLMESTLQILQKWEQLEEKEATPKSIFDTKDTQNQEMINKKKKRRTRTVVAIGSTITLTVGTAAWILPPHHTWKIAASVAGAKLLLDSISDEIVGNWITMLRHAGPNVQRKLGSTVYKKVCKRLERRILIPAWEALEELEAAVTNATIALTTPTIPTAPPMTLAQIWGNMTTSRSKEPDHLHLRVKEAVRKNIRLRVQWALAAAGIVSQFVLAPFLSGKWRPWKKGE